MDVLGNRRIGDDPHFRVVKADAGKRDGRRDIGIFRELQCGVARIALEKLVADAKGDDPLAPVTVAVPFASAAAMP